MCNVPTIDLLVASCSRLAGQSFPGKIVWSELEIASLAPTLLLCLVYKLLKLYSQPYEASGPEQLPVIPRVASLFNNSMSKSENTSKCDPIRMTIQINKKQKDKLAQVVCIHRK
jgi:hypothetical protein